MRIINASDPEEVEASLWVDVQGNTGWDIGANTGQSVKIMAPKFHKVCAFEPAAECYQELNRVVKSYDNVTGYMIAVSDVDGNIDLVDIPDKIESGQLVSFEADGMEYDPYQKGHKLRTVKSRTVDSLAELLGAPDFIKIDVEGHEGKVISGALNTLRQYKPELLIEVHNREIGAGIGAILDGLNYHVDTIRHPHYIPSRPWQAHLWDVHYWYKAKA